MIDIAAQIGATGRTVSSADGQVRVVLTRRYEAEPDDVWDALTDPERLSRWFLPITGELVVGGHFQLEGNAGGDVLECDRPRRIVVTFGGETSIVALRLTPDGSGTLFELDHSVPLEMAGSVAGALYVGPGWDGALMALSLHLDGGETDDPIAAAHSLEAQQFSKESIAAWERQLGDSGEVDADQIAAAVAASLAQFSPDLGGHADS